MSKKNDRYQIRKHPDLVHMVEDLMRRGRYYSYTELFIAAIRALWEQKLGKP